MRELRTAAEVAAACDGDALCVWAAQDCFRAWAMDGAVAVAGPGVSARDRLALHGATDAVVRLVRRVLPVAGPSFRPFGPSGLISAVAARVPGLSATVEFGWMQTGARPEADTDGVAWLDDGAWPEVAALIDEAHPDSYARPGLPGVRRWAGLRVSGRLVAVAADAWSAPSVGFLAGVAVAPDARGRGAGRRVCAFVLDALVARHGRAALMVDAWNTAAIRLYTGLGLTWHGVRAAHRGDRARPVS